jgi:hypothetical protein
MPDGINSPAPAPVSFSNLFERKPRGYRPQGGGAATAPLRFVHTESAAARTAKRAIVGKALERSERETLRVSCVLTFFARARNSPIATVSTVYRSDSRL